MSGYRGKSRFLLHTKNNANAKQFIKANNKSKKKYRGYATHGQLTLILLGGRGLTTHTHTPKPK